MTEAETIKKANEGYVQPYGYMPKSVSAGLDCSLGCIPALAVMTALLRWQMQQLWHI